VSQLAFPASLRPFERLLCVAVLRLQLSHGGLVRINLRLERRLLKQVEKITFLYLGAFDKESLY
jgi:hypothetical protein